MIQSIPEYFLAPCGVNCFACYVHLKRRKPCSGCLGSDVDKPERCRRCEIKQCAKEKGITHCFDCTLFPCMRIKRLDKTYKQKYGVCLIDNLAKAKEIGIRLFQELEKERWSCKVCGGVINQHEHICSECGNKLKEGASRVEVVKSSSGSTIVVR